MTKTATSAKSVLSLCCRSCCCYWLTLFYSLCLSVDWLSLLLSCCCCCYCCFNCSNRSTFFIWSLQLSSMLLILPFLLLLLLLWLLFVMFVMLGECGVYLRFIRSTRWVSVSPSSDRCRLVIFSTFHLKKQNLQTKERNRPTNKTTK